MRYLKFRGGFKSDKYPAETAVTKTETVLLS